jgi:transposase InsO family protein
MHQESPTASILLRHVDSIITQCGPMSEILSDRGPQFSSQEWFTGLNSRGISRVLSSAYHPQTDGESERTIQSLIHYLRAFVTPPATNWPIWVCLAESCINNMVHSTTRFPPNLVMGFPLIGPAAPLFAQVSREMVLSLTHSRLTAFANTMSRVTSSRRQDGPKLHVGDWVFLNNRNLYGPNGRNKLFPRFDGPYRIIQKISELVFKLDLNNQHGRVHPVFHVNLLRPLTVTRDFSLSG